MNKKNPILKSAVLLTLAGLLGKVIGFYNKIFLASLIGAEGIGIYQMVFPLYVLCVSLASSGIQTAISRFTAQKLSTGDARGARNLLYTGLMMAVSLASLIALLLYLFSEPITRLVFQEPRCLLLLQMMAAAIPFEAIHSCITGYYLGQKKAAFPAFSGLLEQLVRVLSILLLSLILIQKGIAPSPLLAAAGLLIAEIFVSVFSITCITFSRSESSGPTAFRARDSFHPNLRLIGSMALPISGNRLCLNLFQSAEAILIPLKLQTYYGNSTAALSSYGILTGMVLPLILFPSAITGSLSLILLPSISEAKAQKKDKKIAATIQATLHFCLLMGIGFTAGFLLFGRQAGMLLYHNETVGDYVLALAWICPFLYLTTTLSGILHGLGKSTAIFFHNMAGLLIRLFFVFCSIPTQGIRGYLFSLLLSQLVIALLGILTLRRCIPFSFS
ncbi:MAG: polysaccharide biosynthesis protein, partial [Lachnospiraceae bacterium]|nr:polysaccharide biosynthesis protein [Lachnospiraceae bacterium]